MQNRYKYIIYLLEGKWNTEDRIILDILFQIFKRLKIMILL